jgi:hypothetical protein
MMLASNRDNTYKIPHMKQGQKIRDGTLPKRHPALEKALEIATQHQELEEEQELEDLATMFEEDEQQEELSDMLQHWEEEEK